MEQESITIITKKRLAVTGLSGFVGWHFNQINALSKEPFDLVAISRSDFSSGQALAEKLRDCDGILHIAGVNRASSEEEIEDGNIGMAYKMSEAISLLKQPIPIYYASTIQEQEDNIYGQSKKAARAILESAAQAMGSACYSWIIPNVYGPFGKPFYNSVVATFCHQLWQNQTLEIKVDKELPLIFVTDLVRIMLKKMEGDFKKPQLAEIDSQWIQSQIQISVKDLLVVLTEFKEKYTERGEVPDISEEFQRNLFNTFLTYGEIKTRYPFFYLENTDQRGSFVELARLGSGGQVSFSTTHPAITRGNHFHTRKAERFSVIKGKARIDLRKIDTNEVHSFYLSGDQPSFVDMPIWYTHNITNVGEDILYTVFWINEPFDANDGDTYAMKV
jgi:UDP-2-acetamido-2,6-beta-L-arabino-hexul-4-ose reductase